MTLFRGLFALLLLVATPLHAATGDGDWLYRGSDISRDTAWTFGTLPNGLRYAVRRNALPAGQVSIRLRIDAGALNESDQERGWAHFIEHMAFRGSKGFADGEARRVWQKLGANFGSDTNATTDSTQTVYQLDLPRADRASLDLSLDVIAQMADSATFDPALVEAERKVVMAEKGRRPELSNRVIETSMPLFYAGLKFADRDTIGTDATLKAATPQGLRAFYERWYRPDRATVIMVGDADPKLMEELIAKRFGGWKPSEAAPDEPDYGAIKPLAQRAAGIAYPGAPHAAQLIWLRPYQRLIHTIAREKDDLAQSLASRIINRRLEAKARGQAAYVSAGINAGREPHVADTTQLSVNARDGRWREALGEVFAIIGDALQAPPSDVEIARELQNLRINATAAVDGERTVQSQQRAQQLINAVDGGNVVATAAVSLATLDAMSPQMTPALVGDAMRELFTGTGPRMVLLSPTPVEGGDAAIAAALAAAEKAKPAARQADRKVSLDDLPPLGAPGKEVSRQTIPDMGVTIVRFANGSSLTFKHTDFERGSVQVQLRFGNGVSGLRPDRPSLAWLGGVVGPSGLADLDLDGLERLLTGRRMGLSFGVSEDAFVLRGQTNANDLGDQMRLLASKLAFPRWDGDYLARTKSNALESYDLAFASAASRAGREFGSFSRGGDPRWGPPAKADIAKADLDSFKAFFAPLLATGPIEAIVVGDVSLDDAIAAMAKSVGALPPRAPTPVDPATRAVKPPAPAAKPVLFTHKGDKDQAYGVIGWSTLGGIEHVRQRRALSLAANMVQTELFEQLREAEGATYSPSAAATSSETQPDWGIFYAAAELRPESTDTFFRIARGIVSSLATRPVPPEDFERAQNPVVSGIERRLKTNAYWLSALENWTREPKLIEQTRSYLPDYASLTPQEVRDAVARYVADAGDWSMLVLPAKTESGGN